MAYCTKCGNPIAEGVHAFCGSCGNPTLDSSSPAQDLPPHQQTTSQQAASQPGIGTPEPALSKKARAKKWVNGYSVTGAAVAAAAIIPGATSLALLTLETTMVLHIGRIYRGEQFSKEDAIAVVGAAGFMGTVGLGAKVAMEGLTFFPVIGWAIKGGIAGSVIKTLGELIIKYFESIERS
ncbi:DUF697 domain-containing protein [Granulicella sp. dw_53]|uniref:DUF697 domain-containing protein n=1 Tax=Granulicella sp. dw_53 TaxID=2719792 RepID=UPI001BD59CFD|nr:DUF697 domain-containing protein [Granulicella sp. dw_53]